MSGEPRAASVIEHAFTRLGETLRPWLKAFGATALVVGGSMVGSWSLIGPPLRAGLDSDHDGRLKVAVAAEPEYAALLGAATYAEAARAVREP